MAVAEATTEEDREQQLHWWRRERFDELGFDDKTAAALEYAGADWHDAEALLKAGCPHVLVVRLLG